jgi:hypothetical protein
MREGRRAHAQPYARITTAHLLAASCNLSPEGFRLLMLMNANWTILHSQRGAEHGHCILPYSEALRHGFNSRQVVARAFKELAGYGLIVLKKAGTSPARSGGARGEAAVWRIPNREGGEAGVRMPLPADVKMPSGVVRWNAGRMRADSAALSGAALKALAALVAWRPRDQIGGLASDAAMAFSTARLAGLLGLPRSTTADAVNELVQSGRVAVVGGGEGSAARRFEIAYCYRKHEKRLGPTANNAGSATGHSAPPSVP